MKGITLSQIQEAICEFSAAHSVLADRVKELRERIKPLEDAIEAAQIELLPGICRSMASDATKREALQTLIMSAPPGLFKDPRTIEFYGVKVGLRASNGSIVMADEDRTVALIEEHLAPMKALLIKTEKTPIKTTMRNLPPEDLVKIEAKLVGKGEDRPVIDAGDEDVLKPTLEALQKIAQAKAKKKK
jgi:hypothetical protein